VSDIASSDDGEDEEDEDPEATEQGQLSEDVEPVKVMGTINSTVQQRIEMCQQEQRNHHELMPPGCEDAADYSCERDMKDGTSVLRVLAVVPPHTDNNAEAPALTTFGDQMECLEIVPGISQMPQGTSRPGGCHMRLGSGKPGLNISVPCLVSATEPDSLRIQNAKHVNFVCFDPCI